MKWIWHPFPKRFYLIILSFQITHPWPHSPSWVLCMKLGLGTLLCSHETIPFGVQSYEPIPLVVLPHRLLACSQTSKPCLLRPRHAHNHHTMDSSPNNSRREHNCSLPIVQPTHVITILRTPRPIAADGNITSSMPIMRPTTKHIPDPYWT